MSKQTAISTAQAGRGRIAVRRLAPANGLTSRQIAQAVRQTLDGQAIQTLSVAVVDDDTMAGLHQRYMNDPRSTDVMAFDLRDDPRTATIAGEIVVSADTARRQADALGLDQKEELLRYVIHGALHLAGMEDRTALQRSRMHREEDRVLSSLFGRKTTYRSRRPRRATLRG